MFIVCWQVLNYGLGGVYGPHEDSVVIKLLIPFSGHPAFTFVVVVVDIQHLRFQVSPVWVLAGQGHIRDRFRGAHAMDCLSLYSQRPIHL